MILSIRTILISCLAASLIASFAAVFHSSSATIIGKSSSQPQQQQQQQQYQGGTAYEYFFLRTTARSRRIDVITSPFDKSVRNIYQNSNLDADPIRQHKGSEDTFHNQDRNGWKEKEEVVEDDDDDDKQSEVPKRVYEQNGFTFSYFPVASVNLAKYGFSRVDNNGNEQQQHFHKDDDDGGDEDAFELFHDFDLSSQIIGNETWVDLLRYRRDAAFPSLSFYVDKVSTVTFHNHAIVDIVLLAKYCAH
jgi:hypothetical protein